VFKRSARWYAGELSQRDNFYQGQELRSARSLLLTLGGAESLANPPYRLRGSSYPLPSQNFDTGAVSYRGAVAAFALSVASYELFVSPY
jgi:hypothetical protein